MKVFDQRNGKEVIKLHSKFTPQVKVEHEINYMEILRSNQEINYVHNYVFNY